jgi:hypothetical protein
VRNGNRWCVYAVDPENNRIAARRVDDNARTVFTGDYLYQHITYGYAVTVHSAQGVTADTTHAVLGESTTRALLYVGMTRGRVCNTAYIYQHIAGEADHQHRDRDDLHLARRGSSRDAAKLLRHIISTHDEHARTAHDVSASTGRKQLPERVGSLVDRRAEAVERRRRSQLNWREQIHPATRGNEQQSRDRLTGTSTPDRGLER